MKILVTGSMGQLGSELSKIAKSIHDAQFTFISSSDLDLVDPQLAENYLSQNSFDWIVNCAAYTAVDKAEADIERCQRLNAEWPKQLAEHTLKNGIRLIHVSSDYVYHHLHKNTPYTEEDECFPQGIYAKTKLWGDDAVVTTNPNNIIFRTSWVYSSYGNNFVKTMIRLGKEREALNVVCDQIGSPTYAADLAWIILKAIEKDLAGGIYNFSNEGVCSWYDFADAIFDISGINSCKLNPIPSSAYPTPASRPHWSVMDKGKIKAKLDISIPHWRHSLDKCIRLLEACPPF